MVRTQGISTPLLAAGALERGVLWPPGSLGPLLGLNVCPLKHRRVFCTEGGTRFPKQVLLPGLAAQPSGQDAHSTVIIPDASPVSRLQGLSDLVLLSQLRALCLVG